MADHLSGIVKIAIGGYILAIFGLMAVRSIGNKKARDDLLSSPHVRNPTALHKVAFAMLAAALLGLGGLLVASGIGNLGAAFG